MARAALVQFAPGRASIYRLPQARSVEHIKEMIEEVSHNHAFIAYTLVLPEFREAVEYHSRLHNIPTVDLLGPLLSRLSELTGLSPMSQPGRLHLLDEKYYKRIAAIEFAIRFDDGKNADGLYEADVILTGVSRTSKTPNCMYLAQHYGLKAANIPIVLGVDLPLQLFEIPSHKIFGLTIEPELLQDIRSNRAQFLGMSTNSDYAHLDKILEEVRYARKIFRELKCRMINVSNKAIEETSSEIMLHLRN
jgi:regulator of PEP synthase PpsR (kinase-PPPase family)